MKEMFTYKLRSFGNRIEVQINWSDEFKKSHLDLSGMVVNGHRQSSYPSSVTININRLKKSAHSEGRKETTDVEVKKFFDALQKAGIVIGLYCDHTKGFSTNEVEFWPPWTTVGDIFKQRVTKTSLYDEDSLGKVKIICLESSFKKACNRVLDAVDNLEMNRGFCTTPKLF